MLWMNEWATCMIVSSPRFIRIEFILEKIFFGATKWLFYSIVLMYIFFVFHMVCVLLFIWYSCSIKVCNLLYLSDKMTSRVYRNFLELTQYSFKYILLAHSYHLVCDWRTITIYPISGTCLEFNFQYESIINQAKLLLFPQSITFSISILRYDKVNLVTN